MSITALTDGGRFNVSIRAGHALALTRIIDQFDAAFGLKGMVSRETSPESARP